MSKKYYVLTAALLVILGSFVAFIASNYLFADLLNKDLGLTRITIFVSLPITNIALMFVVAILYVVRLFRNPKSFKRLSRLYLIYLMVFGLLGFVFSILSGATVYHTFTGEQPFKGYLIICMIVCLIVLCLSCFAFVRLLKNGKEDEEKIKINVLYVLKSIGWFLFVCLSLNRIGGLFYSVLFIQWRHFFLTLPAYLSLLIPALLMVVVGIRKFNLLENKYLARLVINCCTVAAVIGVYVAYIVIGYHNTLFISAISPLLPLERLATMPIETIIHVVTYLVLSSFYLVVAVLEFKKSKKEA